MVESADKVVGCAMCGQEAGKPMRMGLMMALCCILPMALVGLIVGLSFAGVIQTDAFRTGGLSLVMVILCPLMMGGMMVAMMLSKKNAKEGGEHRCH